MNPYLREDIENNIEGYWRDIHKSKFYHVLKDLLHRTMNLHKFCDENEGDLNYSYYLEQAQYLRVGIYVYHFLSGSDVYIHNVSISACTDNKIKKEYIQEIQTRYKLQGK